MPDSAPTSSPSTDSGLIFQLGIFATYVVAAMLCGISVIYEFKHIDDAMNSLALERGRVLFRLIELTRDWNTLHGPFYAPINERNQPNPYLDHPKRDVTTTDGVALTMINPAYMTRQIAELAENADGVRLHITSLRPVRPSNKADAWETESLKMLEDGQLKDRLSLVESGATSAHRYIAPLYIKQPCLVCHGSQGYKIGDIRGGISVTMAAEGALRVRDEQRRRTLLFYCGAALTIAGLLHFVVARTRRHLDNLQRLANQQEILINERTEELSVANTQLRSEIEERKQRENELKISAAVMENAAEGIMVTDGDNRIIRVNPAFTAITGYRPAEVLGKKPDILGSQRHEAGFFKQLWADLEQHGRWSGDIWNRRKDGAAFLCSLAISTISERESGVGRYVATFTDITQRKEAEEQLRHRASSDPLTDLPNRAMFFDRLQQALLQARRYEHPFALLYVDLDHFKEVNDSLGHAAGDQLLIETARRLLDAVRESDTVARLGGDEFAIILEQLSSAQEIEEIARRIVTDLALPFKLKAGVAHVSGSIGIAIYPTGGDDTDTLTHNADRALYQAKAKGRNTYHFHTLPSA
ncbi:MAG: diguanylate cyclase [Rhodocyclaceae bacterium]|nr:diguanylate cyclase [Rhodocyclaceae bacterium]